MGPQEKGWTMNVLQYGEHDILWNPIASNYHRMADAARVCYKSEGSGKQANALLISQCFKNGHHSVLEHSEMTVKFICDRGVTHELVRHRLASYNQESTRYCNYSKAKFGNEITVVKPVRIPKDSMEYYIWEQACEEAERRYFGLLDLGVTPETARAVLPTCLKTEIIVTANLREWYHILDLRTARDAQPDIRYLMHGLLFDMAMNYPEIFEDLLSRRNPEFVSDFVPQKKGNE